MKNLIKRVVNDGPAFCPRCGTPVERAIDDNDESRLCPTCEWWGDRRETLDTPFSTDEFNPVLVAYQSLELYRSQCRRELVLEEAFSTGDIVEADLKDAKICVRQSTNSIVEMFTALWKSSHQSDENTDQE